MNFSGKSFFDDSFSGKIYGQARLL